MYGYGYYTPPPPPPPPSSDFISWLVWAWKWLVVSFHSLGFADPSNGRLALVLIPVFVLAWAFAVYRYWQIRKRYGKREFVDLHSDRFGLAGEVTKFLITRLLLPVGIAVALLTPFLPGQPHYVPAGKSDYAVCFQDTRGMGAPIDDTAAGAGDTTYGATPDRSKGGGAFFFEKGSRLDFARDVTRSLIAGPLANTHISLIAYQGIANVLVPLTDSADWLDDTLDPTNQFGLRVALSAPIGTGEENGKVATIASCLQSAREMLDSKGDKSHEKFIIIFSNGDDISDPAWLADEENKIKQDGIKGMIFGVGDQPVPIPLYKGKDQQFNGYYQFSDGKEALSGYDESTLLKLAAATGWRYQHLDPRHLPSKDWFIQALTNSKIEIGRELVFDLPVYLALSVLVLMAIGDPCRNLMRLTFKRKRRAS